MRRSNFDKMVRWRYVVANAGIEDCASTTCATPVTPWSPVRQHPRADVADGAQQHPAAIIYQHATEEHDRVIADALDAMLMGHVPAADDRNGR